MNGPSLDELVSGRRVLLVNAIRSNEPSGGNTSTRAMLARWKALHLCDPYEFALNPRSGAFIPVAAFALTTLPAALFVLWSRKSSHIWLEYFLRVSPWLFLKCLWTRWRLRPEVVLFNHHASFLYRWAFAGSRCVLIWHDVPSLKRDETRETHDEQRHAATIERLAIRGARYNATFSFDDARALWLLHRRRAAIIPVVYDPATPRALTGRAGAWLLIGNWTRTENAKGTEAFLLACAALIERGEATVTAAFHVAGHGSETFVAGLLTAHPALQALDLKVTPRYGELSDFDEVALLAPLLRGAGIKLKTIEAWATGIPVVGTAQAFTGMPARIWRRGGLSLPSVEAMARLCLSVGAFARDGANLDPVAAYDAYQQAIRDSAA